MKVGVGEVEIVGVGVGMGGSEESGVKYPDCHVDSNPLDPHCFPSRQPQIHFTRFASNCPRVKSLASICHVPGDLVYHSCWVLKASRSNPSGTS